jgi:hypothetical protein
MRTRIGTAAVLVIGTAAWALAQREERPPVPRGTAHPPATPRVERTVETASSPLILPADPTVPALPPADLPTTPPRPAPADPDAIATNFLATAKAEIERLEGEKREAEQELARARAKVQAAEAGMAKWRALLKAVSGALGETEGDATARKLPPPGAVPAPIDEAVESPLPLPAEENRTIEALPAPTPTP